ncbi:MAG: CHASE domain-containing protein [Sulfuriferula sp.]
MQIITLSKKTMSAWAILGMSLLATAFISLQVKQSTEQDAVRQFAFTSDQVTLKIQERLNAYALTLRGGAALFAASISVDRQEWHAYVETLRADWHIPGVQGIGYAQVIPANQLATHIAHIRGEGYPEYSVRPTGARAIYTAIIYLEPFRGNNLRAFGFDMYAEPVRRAAMEQARDSGEPTLSAKVKLVQEAGAKIQAGALMYVPVYRNGMPANTLEQRRAALAGWVYSAYRMDDLMTGILRDWEGHEGKTIALSIYDGAQATSANQLFSSKAANVPNLPTLLHQQRMINFNGHSWLLVFDRATAASGISYADAWATLVSGLVLSGLLFWLMLSIINTRTNAARIADKLTEEVRSREAALQESELRYRTMADFTMDWEYWILPDGTLRYTTPSCEQVSGYTADEFYADPSLLTQIIHPDDRHLYAGHTHPLSAQGMPEPIDFRILTKNGEYRWMGHVCRPVYDLDGRPLGRRASNRDITERKQAEYQVHQLAFYDALTKLPNRRLLNDRLNQSMVASKRSGRYGALMFLDLDNFKPLNDTHGHVVGDLLLVEVAERLKHCVREMDTVSRFGGDEFVVMLSELNTDKAASIAQAGIVAEKIRVMLAEPYLLTFKQDGVSDKLVEHHCTASIGVALFINHEATQEDVLKWADAAMYQAKEAGRNLVIFHDANT